MSENVEVLDKEQNGERSPGSKELTAQALGRFIDVQKKEVEVRAQEAQVKAQEVSSNERIALAAIQAKREDNQDGRAQYNKHLIHRYVFVFLLLVAIFGFSAFAITSGAKEIVADLFKMGSSLIVGAIGGYYAGKEKGRHRPSNDDD